MNSIAIYTLTSPLHDEATVKRSTEEFLGTLGFVSDLKGADYSDYGSHTLDLIYVRTGGTEEVFLKNLPLIKNSGKPVYLLTSGKSNSLAASMEILSYLRQRGLQGEIIHGEPEIINKRINELLNVEKCGVGASGESADGFASYVKKLTSHHNLNARLGVVGKPSNWLISSNVDYAAAKEKLGVELVDIPMGELVDFVNSSPDALPDNSDYKKVIAELESASFAPSCKTVNAVKNSFEGAAKIYSGLKNIIQKYSLDGLTVRCFDLLGSVHNTGCIALAKLNSEGYVAGCEGDIPTALSMLIARKTLGVSGFQANPARVNVKTGEVLFAHCTIPFSMLESYELESHFESGIGVAVRGYVKKGDVTIFKISNDLEHCFIAGGELLENGSADDLCRTQQLIKLDNPAAPEYFLTNPLGNHHVILSGNFKNKLIL